MRFLSGLQSGMQGGDCVKGLGVPLRSWTQDAVGKGVYRGAPCDAQDLVTSWTQRMGWQTIGEYERGGGGNQPK